MFDFLVTQSLRQTDFDERTEFLIPGFLPKRMITLIFADGGMGKSWLAFAVAKRCLDFGEVIYLDFDNPLNVLKERGVSETLIPLPGVYYVQRGKSRMSAQEMLSAMDEKASGNAYANKLVIVDSLRNFGDVMNDAKAMQLMNQLMNLREAGATVLILAHANKDGRNYQGSNNIRNSVDNMYRLTRADAPKDEISFVLTPVKERTTILECAFSVACRDLSLNHINLETAKLNADELDFVTRAKASIEAQPGINKKELLQQLGFEQDDKTARNRLDEFEGVHWASTKKSGVYTYQLA
ncbi:AAA family ATPase [Rheinheimera sp.]|uniref:AAA family ATPase n=1 Tax=Rheinheimera sp. TaxID=1869214 RepID=UPI00307E8293